MNPQSKGSIRHLLSALGGALVAKGYFDAAGLEELINLIEVAGGAAISLAGFIWSWRAKRAKDAEAAQIAMTVVADDKKASGLKAPL